jgi:UDP-glucose 4-epimerase
VKIGVTGSGGFIGRQVCNELKNRNVQTIEWTRESFDITAQPIKTDVNCIIHTAAKTFVPDSWKTPASYYKTNVLGTANVLETARLAGARVIHLSSYVYGNPQKLPINEQHPLQASNPYMHSKILAEEICNYYQKMFQLPITIIRPFNVYGPNQSNNFLIPVIIKKALEEKEVRMNSLKPKRDFIHINDLVNAIVDCALVDVVGTYNVCSGINYSVLEVAKMVTEIMRSNKSIIDREIDRPNEVLEVLGSFQSLKLAIGWQPEITLRDGLKQIING